MKNLSKKNLLVITHDYSSFTKNQIEGISRYFNKITVIVRYKPLAEISRIFPINSLVRSQKKNLIDMADLPNNISIIPSNLYYIRSDRSYKNLGEKHYKAVKKILEKNDIKFDIVHSNFTWSSGFAGSKIAKDYGVPFVVSCRGYDIYDLPFRDSDWRSKIVSVLESANGIISVSRSNRECVRRLGIQRDVDIILNGFNSESFCIRDMEESRNRLDFPQNKKIILSVGNQSEVKGHIYLIKAMKILVEQKKNVVCYLVGTGKLTNNYKKVVQDLGLKNSIFFEGHVNHKVLPIFYSASNLFVLPSLNEGTPNVLLEAMGCGIPIVATNVGGVPDLITDNRIGCIVNPKDSEALAKSISNCIEKDWDSDYIHNTSLKYSNEVQHRLLATHYSKLSKDS